MWGFVLPASVRSNANHFRQRHNLKESCCLSRLKLVNNKHQHQYLTHLRYTMHFEETADHKSQTPRPNLVRDLCLKFELKKAHFPLFSRLPPELRHQIWRIAASSPPSSPTSQALILAPNASDSGQIVHEPHNPSLLATNTEARQVTLTTPRPTRPFNPAIDILYVPRQSLASFSAAVLRPWPWPDWASVHHLALPSTDLYRVLASPDFLRGLWRLRTLSVVYPASSGTVDYFQEVVVPEAEKEGSVYLRLLNDDELAGITVQAEYMQESRVGRLPIRWTRNGVEYLGWAKATLDRTQGQLSAFPVILKDEVRVAGVGGCYKGRCFEVLPVPQRFDM
jgi:hypothetical protein